MSELKDLFRGIAVLIDDELEVPDSNIGLLATRIEAENCYVIKLLKLPTEKQLVSLTEAAFFILDWNLHNIQAEAGISGDIPILRTPSGLSKKHVNANLQFLKKIRARRFAPVFIFTNEAPEMVKTVLFEAGLYSDSPSDHIFVLGKDKVLAAGVFETLTQWIQGHPSAYVLKRWEAAYADTRNSFFVDFYSISHLWPVVLWVTYSSDHVSEAAELTSMIGRNIMSRLAPVQFDHNIVAAAKHVEAVNKEVKPEEVRKVLEGERFIRQDQLQAEVSVGDVFKHQGKYFVNVRPECDCIPRNGGGDDSIDIYLIRGDKVSDKKFHDTFNTDFGNFNDKDTNGTVFAMYDGVTVCFQFKELQIGKWTEWQDKRIGRLIPPYSTKLQQRFASFIQRVALTRIPKHAVPNKPAAAAIVNEGPAQLAKADLTAPTGIAQLMAAASKWLRGIFLKG